MDVGMIGLGRMGGNMARRLLRGGHRGVEAANLAAAHPARVESPLVGTPWRVRLPHSRTKIRFLAQISLSCLGHTVTLTSPRCALRSRSIVVRD